MAIFAKIYLKSTVMACLFVSQTFGATALVEKYDAYRKEAYNGVASNEAIPGYTIKLKNIFRNKPAKRQADRQEKETILKAVIATALIHDDKITLFDSADDTVPGFDRYDGSVRSHFKILWHAEHFARNSIRKVIAGYDGALAQKYAEAEEDPAALAGAPEEARQSIDARQIINSGELNNDLGQLERLSGIQASDFTRWVFDVYNEYSTGLYMDGLSWRTSSEYNPGDLIRYEFRANEHYRGSEAQNVYRKPSDAYTRPDLRSASAASVTASESAYGYQVKGQPKEKVVFRSAYGYQVMDQPKEEVVVHANKRLSASESASAASGVSGVYTTSKPLSRPSDRASAAPQQPARQPAAATYVPKFVSSASVTSESLSAASAGSVRVNEADAHSPAPARVQAELGMRPSLGAESQGLDQSLLVAALNDAIVRRSFEDSLFLESVLTSFHDRATNPYVRLKITKYLMAVIENAPKKVGLNVVKTIVDKYKHENQYDKLISLVEKFCRRPDFLQSPLMQEIANFILKNMGKMQNEECKNGLGYILYAAKQFPHLFVAQKKATLDFMKRKLEHDTELDSGDAYHYAELLFGQGNLEDKILCVNPFLKHAESCGEDEAFDEDSGDITRVIRILKDAEIRLGNHVGASGAVYDARRHMYGTLGEHYKKLTHVLCHRARNASLISEEKRKVEEMLDGLQRREFEDPNMKAAIAIVIAGAYLDSDIGLNAAQYLLRPGIKKPGTEFPTDSSVKVSLNKLLERMDLNETIRSRAIRLLGAKERVDGFSNSYFK